MSLDICCYITLIQSLSDIIIEYSLLLCPRILYQASKYGGIAFGGFVRDWVVMGRSFKDLDVWFKSEDDASRFIASLFSTMNDNNIEDINDKDYKDRDDRDRDNKDRDDRDRDSKDRKDKDRKDKDRDNKDRKDKTERRSNTNDVDDKK